MDEDSKQRNSLESMERTTSSSPDSLSESEQDTSDSLGNLNIQTGASKRSCSEGDLHLDEEQAPKWRCIRDGEDSSSNSNNSNDQNDSNNSSLVENHRMFNFVNDRNSTGIKNTNFTENVTRVSRDLLSTSDSAKTNSPYQSHLGSNQICAAECDIGQASHVNTLPHMIMTRIFRYLSLPDLLRRACLVCQYWRNVAYDPVLWRNISLKLYPKVNDETLLGLVQLSQNVSVLDITDSKFITSEGMLKVLKCCRWLTALKLVRLDSYYIMVFFGLIWHKCKRANCHRWHWHKDIICGDEYTL